MRATRPSGSSVVSAAVLVLLGLVALRFSGPPAPLPDDARADVFSAERAMVHVRAIAQQPHPTGSPDHARVRDYVIKTLESTGLAVERQRTTAVRLRGREGRPRGISAGTVENLMVRIPGTASTGAVLFASHYDSVAAGPGAADDASGVAAMLETVRFLRAGSPLRNDVIALFTDLEEDGLLGAEAFVSRHPWARDVRAVVNLEARGNTGPSQMFETTPGNGAIVRAWAQAVPSPAGASLAYEVYKRLPNDSDFTEFKRLNAVGLNFAFIGNVEAYHTPADSAEALDAGSLQAQGETAFALAKRLGDADLDLQAWRGRDAVYFSMPGGMVLRYSTLWAIPLAALAAIAWAWLLIRLRRSGRASIGGVAIALVLLAVAIAAQIWLGLKASEWLGRFQAWWHPEASPATNGAYALSLGCLATAIWLAYFTLLRKKFAAHTLSLAAMLVALAASAALAAFVPGASYLPFWPLAAALAATAALPAAKGAAAYGPAPVLAALVLAVPAVAILVPTAEMVVTALLLTREGGAALVVLIALASTVLVAQTELVTDGRRWWPAGLAVLLGLGAFASGMYSAPHGPSHPRPENVIYALDANASRATWATPIDPPGEWLAQFVGNDPKRGPLASFSAVAGTATYLSREAPAVALAAPSAEVVSSTREDGGRLLTIRLRSPRNARSLSARIPERDVLDTRINGRPVGGGTWSPHAPAGRWGLEYTNVPAEGVELVVRVRGEEPLTLILVDRSDGIPEVPGLTILPRPPSSSPVHRGDITLVQKSFTF